MEEYVDKSLEIFYNIIIGIINDYNIFLNILVRHHTASQECYALSISDSTFSEECNWNKLNGRRRSA